MFFGQLFVLSENWTIFFVAADMEVKQADGLMGALWEEGMNASLFPVSGDGF